MAGVKRVGLTSRPCGPPPPRPVRRGRHQARAVRVESGANDLARVAPAGGQQRAVSRVPQTRRLILTARGEPCAVPAEGESPDDVVVALAKSRLLSGSGV